MRRPPAVTPGAARARGRPAATTGATPSRRAEFEQVYRANVAAVTSYFARRTHDPQTAADLTADTFLAAIRSFGRFDPTKGSPRAWIFGIAANTFARHCARSARDREAAALLGGHRQLTGDEAAEMLDRIDAERAGRVLLEGLAALSPLDREAVDLVHVAGLTPKEAAAALRVAPGTLRIRLFRVRKRLRALADHPTERTT